MSRTTAADRVKTTMQHYPLLLEPLLLEKVWGGDRLARFGKHVKPGARIGESWELADLASTSAGGAGGGAFHSRITNGPLAGQTLSHAIQRWGAGAFGLSNSTPNAGYPLLVKYLDAREHLSVQVHPNAEYAATHPGASLKSECWYILAAEPGAVIYKGLRPGVTRESFARAIRDGTVPDQIVAVPAIPGECHNLPSGTCHALGAGVLILEVQTASDTTFRVYDWGRPGRELHIEQALECIDFTHPPPPAHRFESGAEQGGVMATDYFTLSQRRVGPAGLALDRPGPFMVISGAGRLEGSTPGAAPLPIGAGTTGLAPAGLTASTRLVGEASAPLVCMFATVQTVRVSTGRGSARAG